MKISTALNHKSRFLGHVKEIFSIAHLLGLSHHAICQRFRERVSESDAYRRCPEWVHQYITGYRDALFDSTHRDSVTWHVWFEGKHVIGKDSVPDGRWAEVDAEKGAYLWNNNKTKVFIGYDPKSQTDVSSSTADSAS